MGQGGGGCRHRADGGWRQSPAAWTLQGLETALKNVRNSLGCCCLRDFVRVWCSAWHHRCIVTEQELVERVHHREYLWHSTDRRQDKESTMAKGMFARMTDILRSNLNEALDRAEDPEKLIRQMIREMEEAVNKATASVGTAVANQKRLERQHDERAQQVDDWQRKAERAVEASEDELARRALERKTVLQRAVDDLAPAVEESRRTAQQLREQLRELKGKLEEARTRQGTLMARHRAAEERKKLAQSIHGLGEDAFSSFERFEQRVEETEAEAEAHDEVKSDLDDVERRVRDLDRGAAVEDELKALKSRLMRERDASRDSGA